MSDPASADGSVQDALAKEKRKKTRLEIGSLRNLVDPNVMVEQNRSDKKNASEAMSLLLVKPGHWTATRQTLKANYLDFVGRRTVRLLDKKGRSPPLEATRYRLHAEREVALAKGRDKQVAGWMLIPEHSTADRAETALRENTAGRRIVAPPAKLVPMPSYQYRLVVLAKEPAAYGFLKVADAVRMPWEEEAEQADEPHYRVVLASTAEGAPLSENMLMWSSVAAIFWDEVDPDMLTSKQQSALIDWLHWGGRIIINGPDSLELLRGSFLESFLPVARGETRTIDTKELRRWTDYWSERENGKPIEPLVVTKPWSGIELLPQDKAHELDGGEQLFFEQRVGQGSVVVSAFRLTERELINWSGYDSFLNAGLLRRPRRRMMEGSYGGLQIDWADHLGHRLDAHLVTGLRMFARDAVSKANAVQVKSVETSPIAGDQTIVVNRIDRPGGLGAWSAFGPVANAARDALSKAAAVRVPGRSFVLMALLLYLAVLVPLNWLVFRSVRRIEWAWIGAPAIALLGTWAIVRQAQLDIGFVRSETEIALLELQSPYERGLLSRFTALYSSLSTTYEIAFDEATAVATPFPVQEDNSLGTEYQVEDVLLDQSRSVRLGGLSIASSSTRMVRSEQMFALDGDVALGQSSRGQLQLENRSGYRLRDVMVVERRFDRQGRPEYRGDWIGEMRSRESALLSLSPVQLAPGQSLFVEQRRKSAEDSTRLGVEQLVDLAIQFPTPDDPAYAKRGETRMIGVIDELLPGTKISPSASQVRAATVVLAHLSYADLPPARPDQNSPSDVLKDDVRILSLRE